MKILLICGGSSGERNISLNSARSVYDNISRLGNISAEVLFVNADMDKYLISEEELYSNTASDFRYLLSGRESLDDSAFGEKLRSVDLVFPLIHGRFGEDGVLQEVLELAEVPFVASGSKSCRLMYNKKSADINILKKHGFYSVPKLFVSEPGTALPEIRSFFREHGLSEVVVKPVEGGSSIGVGLSGSPEEAAEMAAAGCREYGEMVVETRCEGKEFTVIILEHNGEPVALIPSEIENDGIFDTRKKYLSTGETTYYCPPRFNEDTVHNIREQAERLFSIVGAKDFLRIDGWVMGDGSVYFSDFNPISGTEQNSFIFQQATRIGFTHASLLLYIVNNALSRFGMAPLPCLSDDTGNKSVVNVLLGGATSERNVSLMSGGNVWLKLLSSGLYRPVPYLLFAENGEYFLQKVPYPIMLNHTVEEMRLQLDQETPKYYESAVRDIVTALGAQSYVDENVLRLEAAQSLSCFTDRCAERGEYVFIGLHGGFGENGELQALLEEKNVSFNGSGSVAARLCMSKYETGVVIDGMSLANVRTCKKLLAPVGGNHDFSKIWNDATQRLGSEYIVAKPNDDGCSTGVVVLTCEDDLKKYVDYCKSNESIIPKGVFRGQEEKIQLSPGMRNVLLEEYIPTDTPEFVGNKIVHRVKSGWIELTVGVTENNGKYRSFLPSIAIAESGNRVLTLEEKFQGGTGVNITPPPGDIINSRLVGRIQHTLEEIAKKFNVKDYCRIDIFVNSRTEEIIIIEINTLPGLSPSTVLFQQAAKENLSPRELIEQIISK